MPIYKTWLHRVIGKLCSNEVPAKVIGGILPKGFYSKWDQRTSLKQNGFKPERGCTDQMHNVCPSLEQRWSFQQATVVCLESFASAFDSVDRDFQWWIMAADGMPP